MIWYEHVMNFLHYLR